MTAPAWLDAVVREFAQGLGLSTFALNADGAAALRFENGVGFRLEYAAGFLTLSMSLPSPAEKAAAKMLLTAADPLRRGAFALRTGFLANPSRALFAVRLASQDVTLGAMDSAMAELWRAVENYRRRLES